MTNSFKFALVSPFRRGCVTADRLLSCFNGHTKFLGLLRRHYRLCLAKHPIFICGHMFFAELVEILEFRYPLMVISRSGFEFIKKRFDLAVRF